MSVIMLLFKVILIIWNLLIVGNYFRSLCSVLVSLMNKTEVDTVLVSRAKVLLLFCVVADWITAVSIHYGELLLYGKSSEYSAEFLFIVGDLFLVIALISAVFAVAVAWSEDKQTRSFAVSFKRLVGTCFSFAIVLLLSTLAI